MEGGKSLLFCLPNNKEIKKHCLSGKLSTSPLPLPKAACDRNRLHLRGTWFRQKVTRHCNKEFSNAHLTSIQSFPKKAFPSLVVWVSHQPCEDALPRTEDLSWTELSEWGCWMTGLSYEMGVFQAQTCLPPHCHSSQAASDSWCGLYFFDPAADYF